MANKERSGWTSEPHLPLAPATFQILLLALADAERHGYAIMKEGEERTEGVGHSARVPFGCRSFPCWSVSSLQRPVGRP